MYGLRKSKIIEYFKQRVFLNFLLKKNLGQNKIYYILHY